MTYDEKTSKALAEAELLDFVVAAGECFEHDCQVLIEQGKMRPEEIKAYSRIYRRGFADGIQTLQTEVRRDKT